MTTNHHYHEWPWIHSSCFKEVYSDLSTEYKLHFIRTFLIEGIPFRFKDAPRNYENMVGHIGRVLNIDKNNVCIVGSSKLGYSLAPSRFGDPIKPTSDYDALIVSEGLFEILVKNYQSWLNDLANAKIRPYSKKHLSIWIDNIRQLDSSIHFGYINNWYLPPNKKYECAHSLYMCINRVKKTNNFITDNCKLTFRVYRNWKSVEMNLAYSLQYLL